MTREELVQAVAGHLHADQRIDAAREVARFSGVDPRRVDTEPVALEFCNSLLHWCLNNGHYEWAAQMLWTPTLFDTRPRCTQLVWDQLQQSQALMLMGAASMSKCLAPDTLVRAEDGRLVRADEVRVGDSLAGDDGTPRRVLQTTAGRAEMFEISPEGAEPFRCNGDHLLTLVCTWTKRNHGGRYGISSGYTPGKIVDVPVREYLTWSRSKKRAYRLFSRGYELPERPVEVDPYIYGAWLGGGTCIRAELTSPEGPMQARWSEYWASQGFQVKRVSNRSKTCPSWFVHNGGGPIWPNAWFRGSVRDGAKFILPEYLCNSRAVRLQLLAGLLDSDGCYSSGGYLVVSKWQSFADQIADLARSLGFRVTQCARNRSIKSRNFIREYYHVRIMGAVESIPCLEWKPSARVRGVVNGDPTYAFTVRSVGEGDYAGFTLDGNHRFLLGSGIVTHNSYGAGAWLLLDWLRDPEYTSVNLVGPSEDHLKANLFTHLITMHSQSTIPLPGVVKDLFIGLDPKRRKGAIRGVIIPVGKRPAGRLQGTKRVRRTKRHPIFGDLSRIRFFLDEVEKIPIGVWKDIDNVFANLDGDADGFKIACAFNPEDPNGETAQRCEPEKGWDGFDPDTDEVWDSKRGWRVLRLDAAKCENVVEQAVRYPGLQTYEGFQAIIRNAGGTDTPGYWTMARACFPRSGAVYSVLSTQLVQRLKGEFIFADEPQNCAACDLALEGNDTAEMAVGRFGRAVGLRIPPRFENPQEEIIFFKDKQGRRVLRWALQVDQIFPLEKGDTLKIAEQIKKNCLRFKVNPAWLMLDRTGNGAGVHDVLKGLWSEEVRGVNYQESATDKKILEEDTKTAKEEYERVVSELWFALKKWAEFNFLRVKPEALSETLIKELTGRRYSPKKLLTRVETKLEYKSRNNPSPNKADALTLLLHGVRMASGVIPSAVEEVSGTVAGQGGIDEPVPVFVCAANRFEDLDSEPEIPWP